MSRIEMSISNSEIAKILYEIGEYLAMQDVPFKPRAYEKVAMVIEGLEEEAEDIYKKGGLKALEEIPGVGISIAEKIEEFLKTGRLKYYDELKKKTPVDLAELTAVEGIGPKSIRKLYQKLGVRNLADLEKAAKTQKIRTLEGFGEKVEEKILASIGFLKKGEGRFLLGNALPLARMLEERLNNLSEVQKAVVAGSVRRRKETIGDIDILVTIKGENPAFAKASAGRVMDYFTRMPEVARVSARGETKSSVKLSSGINVDVRVVPEESYGAALNYFTGSKDHNVALRQIAITKGWKLNEYGLFQNQKSKIKNQNDADFIEHSRCRRSRAFATRSEQGRNNAKLKMIAGRTEKELYRTLGLVYIEPEMRENFGEIELARKNALPKLIGYDDTQGDLQVQTNWTDGSDSIEDMANAAIKIGLKYIAVTDHTKRLSMTHGLDEKRILKQMAEIDRINKKFRDRIKILKGTECDILKNGSLDLPDEILLKLDVVGVSVHSHFNLSRTEQTERIKRAMENPSVDILFHPTGRLIQKREAYNVDIDEIIACAKKTGTVLEINAEPNRLDLKDEYIRKCVEAGVKMAIDSDAHAAVQFSNLEFGIAQARRGWAEKKDVINAWPLEKMLQFLK